MALLFHMGRVWLGCGHRLSKAYLDGALGAAGWTQVEGQVIHIVLHRSGVCPLYLRAGSLGLDLHTEIHTEI